MKTFKKSDEYNTVEYELFQRIEGLQGQMKILERSMWVLEHPPQFKRGEIAEACYSPESYKPEISKVEVLDCKIPYWEKYRWKRRYQVRRVNGELGGVDVIDEDMLIKIDNNNPAKS